MKFIDLAQHVHEIRASKSGRPVGAAMRVTEVWSCAIASPLSSISEILYYEASLPRPFDGLFVRLVSDSTGVERAAVYVEKSLDRHWKEFVAIKETMHCWSPGKTYVGSEPEVKSLVEAHCASKARYSAAVVADHDAILAAAEVMLPHFTVERHLKMGHDMEQLAAHHGLHPDIVREICRFDVLHARKNGSF